MSESSGAWRDAPVLGVSLAAEPVVGSNLRGEMAGAGWLYALPRLRYPRIVVVGRPSRPTLAGLRRAGEVTVVHPSRDSGGSLDLDGPIDLLVIDGAGADRTAGRLGLERRLGPSGVVVRSGSAAATPQPTGAHELRLDLTPLIGEVRAAVPVGDARMRIAVRAAGLEGSVFRRRRVARWAGAVTRRLPAALVPARRASVRGPGLPPMAQPPDWLTRLAAPAGVDLRDWGWAVAARGDYDSQKVLLLLAEPDAPTPSLVVKVTRSPAYDARLRNEAAALSTLAELDPGTGRVPVPRFSGTEADRAVLGITLLSGRPFEAHTGNAEVAARDPRLQDALGWLTTLAVRTARPRAAGEIAGALLDLLDRYVRIYRPAEGEHRALRDGFESLALHEDLPIVFQHGDPGIWNLLDADGRVAFLDWEAAEPAGMPLWDVWYLFRSFAIATSRRAGVRDRVDGAARHLLEASPLRDRLTDAVGAYARAIGLPEAAIEPLSHGCWMHRALKESTRLRPADLDAGHSVRLLRRMLARPDTLGPGATAPIPAEDRG